MDMRINDALPAQGPPAGTSGATNQLDQDAFMKILVAQLRYQDPLSPMNDREFIAQMTQFSTLNQVQTLVRNQMTMLGASLLGQRFVVETASGQHSESTVTSIRWNGDQLLINTDDGRSMTLREISGLRWAGEGDG